VKKHKIKFFGKEYILQFDFDEKQINRIKKDIEEKIKYYQSQYPNADKIDILVVLVLNLMEELYRKDKKLIEKDKNIEILKKYLNTIEEKVKEKIVDLTTEI